MRSNPNPNEFLIPNLVRPRGLHIFLGGGSRLLARRLHERLVDAGKPSVLLEPSSGAGVVDVAFPTNNEWCATMPILLVAPMDWTWRAVEIAQGQAEISIQVVDGWAFTVKGGMPGNPKPIEIRKLPQFAISSLKGN
jgi:hypothetical protein